MKLSTQVILTNGSWAELSAADNAVEREALDRSIPPGEIEPEIQDLAAALQEANPNATWIISRHPSGSIHIELKF